MGAVFKGYRDSYSQDLILEKHVILYRKAFYELPDGSTMVAELPKNIHGGFGPKLRQYILVLHHQCNVPQPRILQMLLDMGIKISAGEIDNILTEEIKDLESECDDILTVGLEVSNFISVDDTGARFKKKNGVCTVIQNDFFAFYKSADSKSREAFLRILRGKHIDYAINDTALAHIEHHANNPRLVAILQQYKDKEFASFEEFEVFLRSVNITKLNTGKQDLLTIAQAGILGSAVKHGLNPDIIILSDGASQFNILLHALCWVHAVRAFERLIPVSDAESKEIESILTKIWQFYELLKAYKLNPSLEQKEFLEKEFDQLFQQPIESMQLAAAVTNFRKKKKDLLVVLDHPYVPLHTNATETDIRTSVIKRKISGPTRGEDGRRCRDLAMTLIKTCRKLGVSPWAFFGDRLCKINAVMYLPDLIRLKASLGPPQVALIA